MVTEVEVVLEAPLLISIEPVGGMVSKIIVSKTKLEFRPALSLIWA